MRGSLIKYLASWQGDGEELSSQRGGTFLIWGLIWEEKRRFMSVGRFFRMMMGVVLCLMMQLPPFAMHAAMADGMKMSSPQGPAQQQEAASSITMAMPGMEMVKESPSARMGMEGDMAPCCQSHHAVCEAGLLPETRMLAPAQLWQKAFLLYDVRLALRSSVVNPWRPPAILPV